MAPSFGTCCEKCTCGYTFPYSNTTADQEYKVKDSCRTQPALRGWAALNSQCLRHKQFCAAGQHLAARFEQVMPAGPSWVYLKRLKHMIYYISGEENTSDTNSAAGQHQVAGLEQASPAASQKAQRKHTHSRVCKAPEAVHSWAGPGHAAPQKAQMKDSHITACNAPAAVHSWAGPGLLT
eukprot:1150478-Pelagomonas_calceolata.AAC.4